MSAKVFYLRSCFVMIQDTVASGGHRDPKRLHFVANTAEICLDSYNTYVFQLWVYRQSVKLETEVSIK